MSYCDLFNPAYNPWHHTSNESRVVVLIRRPFADHLTIYLISIHLSIDCMIDFY